MGYIYIIKNSMNDKVYIGQTTRTINKRFEEHLNAAINAKTNNKLYKAMKEIGLQNFYVEKLMECDEKDLNKFEQQFVAEFNSIHNGYNTVYPLTGLKVPVRDYEDKLVELFYRGYSLANIAVECNISQVHVSRIINEYGLKRENFISENIVQAKALVMYDEQFNPLKWFRTIREAYNWIMDNYEYNKSTFGFYEYVKVAANNGNVAYGHRWQYYDDLEYNGLLFRSKYEKEAYINGAKAYQPENKKYYVVDGVIEQLKTIHRKNYCIECGKEIGYKAIRCEKCNSNPNIYLDKCKQCGRLLKNKSKTGLCNSCLNVIAKGKSPKPSKEKLEQLLKYKTIKDIAKIYKRNESTVRYWIKNYNLN